MAIIEATLVPVQEGVAPLRPRSLPDQAADAIVQAVASGAIRPGERVVEQKLAAALGISRVPVREGLRVLAAQGLVTVTPHRGCRVAEFDEQGLRQLKDVRVALERLAARGASAAYRTNPQATRPLHDVVGQMAALVERGDRFAMSRLDLQFHRALWTVAGNDMLLRLWEAISRHILVIFGLETETERDFAGIYRQHAHLLAVVEAGELAALDEEIEGHIKQLRHMYADQDSQKTR